MKTIKQIADALGVSKQAISKRLVLLPPTSVTTNERGVKLIDAGGEAVLMSMIPPTKPPTEPPTISVTEMLKLQHKIEKLELEKELREKNYIEKIEILDRELKRKDDIIHDQLQTLKELQTSITSSLQAAQALHAGTMKYLPVSEEKKPSLLSRIFKREKGPSA